jgi:hypothetical protein
MGHSAFRDVLDSLLGDWRGHRRGQTLQQELVWSRWQNALDGNFLHEDWRTAGESLSPAPTAEAFFHVTDSGPGDFIAVYKNGKIAFGESTFANGVWSLTHRWLRESGVAAIRLRFLDADTYEQAVYEVMADGRLTEESVAIMKRERVVP